VNENRPDRVSLSVAHNITGLRRSRGWSLRKLSDRCADAGKRIAIGRLSRIETSRDGSRTLKVSVDDLVVLAAAFEVSTDHLLAPWDPQCTACLGSPPPGYPCPTCGEAA
jgi:transcriptional regulator with XRE-family HTH domain